MPRDIEGKSWGAAVRAPTLSNEESRARVIDTALSMLGASGLTVSLENSNLEELIREAEVPRSAFYRLWPAKRK